MSNKRIEFQERACPICGAVSNKLVGEGPDYEYRTTDLIAKAVVCADCDTTYLSPAPTPATLPFTYPLEYKPYHMGKHSNFNIIFFIRDFLEGAKAKSFGQYLPERPKILDVGCGDGRYLFIMQKALPDSELTGVDFSSEAVEDCRKRGLTAVCGDYLSSDFDENCFDLINLNQVIEHIMEPVPVIEKIWRELAPGGIVNLETPSLDGLDFSIFRRTYWGGYHFPRHLTFFTAKTLAALLKSQGFKIIKISYMVSPVFWVFSWHHAWEAKVGAGAGFFSDKNPFALAAATCLDIGQKFIRGSTSNMRVIAQKMKTSDKH